MNQLSQPDSRPVSSPRDSSSTRITDRAADSNESLPLQPTCPDLGEDDSLEPPSSKSPSDRDDYQRLKSQLQASKARQAEILWEVKTRELYYLEYRSFERFCEAELGYGRRQCDRMANWGRVRLVTEQTGPARESHARPLNSIKEREAVQRLWEEVKERNDSITADAVRDVVRDFTTSNTNNQSSDSSEGNGPENGSGGDQGDDSGEESEEGSENNSGEDNPEQSSSSSGGDTGDVDPVPEEGCFLLLPSKDVVPDSTESQEAPGDHWLVDCRNLSDQELKTTILNLEADGTPVSQSSGEEGIADSLFAPMVQSLQDFSGSLSQDPDPACAIFRPKRLSRIQSARCRGKRALVCPAVDIFSPVVPDVAARLVLKSVEDAEPTPILYTEHLERARTFSLPNTLWIGTGADRSDLKNTHRKLGRLPNSVGKWILYDVEDEDGTDGLPVSPSNADWVVYDPPEGSGVSLTIGQISSLVSDAEDCDASWSFRGSFKTGGASFPE